MCASIASGLVANTGGDDSTISTGELATEPAAEVLASETRSKLRSMSGFFSFESRLFDVSGDPDASSLVFAPAGTSAFVLKSRLSSMLGADDVGVGGRLLGDLGMS